MDSPWASPGPPIYLMGLTIRPRPSPFTLMQAQAQAQPIGSPRLSNAEGGTVMSNYCAS